MPPATHLNLMAATFRPTTWNMVNSFGDCGVRAAGERAKEPRITLWLLYLRLIKEVF
jgi:hypothetical protein